MCSSPGFSPCANSVLIVWTPRRKTRNQSIDDLRRSAPYLFKTQGQQAIGFRCRSYSPRNALDFSRFHDIGVPNNRSWSWIRGMWSACVRQVDPGWLYLHRNQSSSTDGCDGIVVRKANLELGLSVSGLPPLTHN